MISCHAVPRTHKPYDHYDLEPSACPEQDRAKSLYFYYAWQPTSSSGTCSLPRARRATQSISQFNQHLCIYLPSASALLPFPSFDRCRY